MGTHEELLNRWSLENSNENHLKRWWEIDPAFLDDDSLTLHWFNHGFQCQHDHVVMSYSDPYFF